MNQPRSPARIRYPRGQSNERHDFQIRKPAEGSNWRDFAYREPGNLYVPSWNGTGWAPGGFTPASAARFDGNNRMVNTGLGIQYDAAGNLTAIGGFSFSYDAENRLVSSTFNGVTATYAYDGEGRRVKKGTMVLVYDAFGRLAAEYGGVADPVGMEYLTADPLGSTRLVTSASGAERRCLDYLPFGEQMVEGIGSRGACYASANEARDAETGKLLGMRVVAADHSYKSGSALEAHFGLGKQEKVRIDIVLPGGRKVAFPDIAADQYLDLDLTKNTSNSL